MIQSPRRFVALATLCALVGFAGSVSAQDKHDKIDRSLREGRNKSHTQRVIVKSKAGYDTWVRQLLAQRGKLIESEMPSIGAVAVDLTSAELDAICLSAVSDGCSGDVDVSPSSEQLSGQWQSEYSYADPQYWTNSSSNSSTMLRTLGLSPSWKDGGDGVVVALVDSGIHPAQAFGNRITAFYDFTKGGTLRQNPYDDYGHGTHVAGLIGGFQRADDLRYQGVAPGVQFVGLKVLDKNGRGKTSDVIRAIEFAIANKRRFGIDIINLSLGHPIYEPAASDPLVQAVEKATKAGIIVVASAGNYGVDANGKLGFAGITSPGNAPSSITVGCVDHNDTVTRDDDRMAVYSSSGPTWYDGLVKPDVVAPGYMIGSVSSPNSALSKGYPKLLKKGDSGLKFLQLSGTSMAAGVTTGVVALMKQAMPELTPNLAKGVLQFSAIPMHDDSGETYSALRQGTGEINAEGAVKLVSKIKLNVTSLERQWVSVQPKTTIGSKAYAWAGNIVWGDNIVWGETVYYNLPIWGLNTAWGSNIVWGENIVWGNNIVWGDGLRNDNIVWGNNIVWGENIVWGNNIVWGENIVWGNNIVWGENLLQAKNLSNAAFARDNIVWGNLVDENIVWGNSLDNIVWGNSNDNIVWGNLAVLPTSGKGGQ